MKAIFTLLLTLLMTTAFAQDPVFVHTATAGNISSDASFIDHPDLNGNPNARLLVTHNWNPAGGAGVYNDQETGLFYSNGQNQWAVYNESADAMIVGTSYNIYIGQGTDVNLHIADLANQGSIDGYSVLNHPDLNGNPNARIVLSTYYNPNNLRNDHPYGVWYDDTANRWNIFTEDFATIPLDSAFFYSVEPDVAVSVKHVATAGNISGNWTNIDHPLLNNNPNGIVLVGHNWGTSGASSNVIVDTTIGVWYTGSNWAIFNEDLSAMPQDAEFDLLIFDPTLGTDDNVIEGLTYAPNPTTDFVTIQANEVISSVRLYNILGQELTALEGDNTSMQIDLTSYATGNYFAKVQTDSANETIKLIKR